MYCVYCVFYRYSDSGGGTEKVFYCTDNNKTMASQGRSMLGSVQLPSTLYYQVFTRTLYYLDK